MIILIFFDISLFITFYILPVPLFLLMTSHFWELRSSEDGLDDIGTPKDWHYYWYRVVKKEKYFFLIEF